MSAESTPNPLSADLPEVVRDEIEVFQTELERFLAGKMSEKLFTEFRLRHGTYGQRQDDVQMLRIKIPLGRLSAAQCDVLADLAEEYADSILHVTTRQDVQFHFVDLLDAPTIFRRLAAVGITTKEACGNSVRNVTCCPTAGVCGDEPFDVTPHAEAMAYFLLRHPDAQNFGRKFKIAFSGCAQHACGLARIHDIGAIAATREIDGATVQGFAVWVGGGLGAVPHQAELYSEFVPTDEMLAVSQAIARVFARLGEKNKRARARMKFLVANLGIEEFRRLVDEELAKLPDDPRRSELLDAALARVETPLRSTSDLDLASADLDDAFRAWHHANVRAQSQPGRSVATVFLPLGDLTSAQFRGLARVAREFVGDAIRLTVEQNVVLRHVANGDLPALWAALRAIDLAAPLANSIADITACPGTDSCKLGISSSRGLAAVLHEGFVADAENGIAPRNDIEVKISGCFNSCGQHHIANIGFFGTSKRKSGRVAPLFQVVLGGTAENNADAYGLAVAKCAAHRAPELIRKLTSLYDDRKENGESFNACMARLGKAHLREQLAEFGEVGDAEADYYDNRQPWQYVKEVGVGECAGEVVDQAEFQLEDGERLIFEASLHLEADRIQEAAQTSFRGMKAAGDALLSTRGLLLSDNYDTGAELDRHFFKPGDFFPGVAEYFDKAAAEGDQEVSATRARQRVEEANLFVEEAHVVYSRMAGSVVK